MTLVRQKQPSRGVVKKRCSENKQQIYRRKPCRSAISIKLQRSFIEMVLRHGCSPVNLLHLFGTPFHRNTFGWLLLVRRIKGVTNTYSLHCCLPSEITLSFFLRVMLFIFVPLSNNKGFIAFQNVLQSVTLFSSKLLWHFFLSFVIQLTTKTFLSFAWLQTFCCVLKYFEVFSWLFREGFLSYTELGLSLRSVH